MNAKGKYLLIVCSLIMLASLPAVMAISPIPDTLTTSPTRIFKCQSTAITATYSGPGIVAVDALLLERNGTYTDVPLSTADGGLTWIGSYGNDANLSWGNKTLLLKVDNGAISYFNTSGNFIFVYSDVCTGTNIVSYKNVTSGPAGLGNYTKQLFTTDNFFAWLMLPYLDYWGNGFYLFVLFGMATILYMKNQRISQAVFVGIFGLIVLGGAQLIPQPYAALVLAISCAVIGILYWKVWKT